MRRLIDRSRHEDVCRWKTDPQIGRYHIPGCMGGAVCGPSGCTCGTRNRSTSERITDLEEQVAELTARLALAEQEKGRG